MIILIAYSVAEINVGIIVACSSILPKFYTSTKEFTSSVYQSFANRTSRFDSLVDHSKAPSLENEHRMETRVNSAVQLENNSKVFYTSPKQYSSRIGHDNEIVYQVTQPIFRTDSYEVVYSQYK